MRADRLLGQNRDIIYSGENSLCELTTDLWSGYGISKEPEGQLARWLERLQEYNFDVVHRQGLRHCNADALSRIPCRQCDREEHDEAKNTTIVGVIITNPFQKYIAEMRLDDTTIQPVQLAYILWLQEEALRDLHQCAVGGHIGEEKMIHRLKERLYWPRCTEAVREWCRNCRSCATRKTTAPKRRAHLLIIKADYPLQIVSVDLIGPLPETEDGCKYVMVAVDCFTRWVEVYAIQNQEAKTVAKKLVDEMFCRFSPPEQLHSDHGTRGASLRQNC
eukprot:Em0007g944a